MPKVMKMSRLVKVINQSIVYYASTVKINKINIKTNMKI